MDFTKIIIAALIAEALWETSKLFWQKGKLNIDRVGAVIIGIVLAFLARVNLFDVVGMPISIPFIGEVLTGLLLSRGANFLHDIIGSINGVYSKTKKISS